MPRTSFLDRFNASMMNFGTGVSQGLQTYKKNKLAEEEAARVAELAPIQAQTAQSQANIYEQQEKAGQMDFENRLKYEGLVDKVGALNSKPLEGQLQPGDIGPKMAPDMVHDKKSQRLSDSPLGDELINSIAKMKGEDPEIIRNRRLAKGRTKTFAEEKALIDARNEGQLNVAEGKSQIKVEQPLTKAEKSRERIAGANIGLKREKGQREEKMLGFAEEKADVSREKALEAHKSMKLKKSSQIEEIKSFSEMAKRLSKSEHLGGVTGVGKIGKYVPGTPWADANADLDRLMAMGAIASMVKMKAESPTGSTGFGALSQKELKVIQDSFAALEDKNQSPEHMRGELNRISKVMDKYLTRIEKFESLGEVKKATTTKSGYTIEEVD